METSVFIVDAVRTPRAKKKGKYSSIHPVDLLTFPIKAIFDRSKISEDSVEDIFIGCVTQITEQGWCIARRSILAAGLPIEIPGVTINRLCGSGQQAVNTAAHTIASGDAEVLIAGGVEHMTRVPMFSDCGGEDSQLIKLHHPHLVQQGEAAELIVKEYQLSRERIDVFSFLSQQRAARALKEGRFCKSIISIPYKNERGEIAHLSSDDTVRESTSLEALQKLTPVFREDGVITAGNSSAIVDGAAAVLLMSEKALGKFKLTPRARIVTSFVCGSDPLLMLTGPIAASKGVLKRANLSVDDISVWEINEAFAPVPIITIDALHLDPERINPNGGGISLGHPLGATGAMLIGSALDELERIKGKYALITMCIGLGMGIATIIERI